MPAARRFAEEFGVLGESMGMPRMVGRLWGWLLICDPPQQSSADIAQGLGVSRASVSIATRLLVAAGFIRRSTVLGGRGHYFEAEADPQAFMRLPAEERFRALRRQLERGLEILDDSEGPRGARLRAARDFYGYVEREMRRLMAAYLVEHQGVEEST